MAKFEVAGTGSAEARRQQIRQECAARGLRINPYGNAYWIEGRGVSIVCTDLATLSVRELEPVYVADR